MNLIWIFIILAIFWFFASQTNIIESLITTEDQSTINTLKNQETIESDYTFPVRDLELGRDPAGEAGRGNYNYDIPITRETFGELVGMEKIPNKIPGMPESATQIVPIPMPNTNNMINDGGPMPTNEVSDVVASVTNDMQIGSTIGVQGEVLDKMEDSPSIQQFKKLGVARVNRIPNIRILHDSGFLGIRTAEDEFECIAKCQDQNKCGMYSYQPKQKVCYLHQKPNGGDLSKFLERAPTYQTGFINRSNI